MPKNQLTTIKKTSEFVNVLIDDYGYHLDRQSGSHMIYKDGSGHSVSIVKSREIAPGTARQIAKVVQGSDYYNKK